MPLVAIGRPELDLESGGTIEPVVRAINPRAIINAAAYTAVDRAESEPDRAFAVNRDGAGRLAREAQRRGVPLIHISTDYVFDGRKSSPYVEADPAEPLNVYGRSKLEGEAAVREACADAIVLRTSWLYSAHDRNFLTTMLRLAEKQNPVRVVDDQHGTPTAAGDLATALLEILEQVRPESLRSAAGIYHLTARGETTWHGFAAAIFAGCARRGRDPPRLVAISSAEYPTAAVRPANSRLDCSRVEQQFGIRLPPWQQSLDPCLDQVLTRAEPERC